MKRKIFLTVATVLATTTLFASCSCDSCAGNTKVSFKPYFLYDVDFPAEDGVQETLSYSVAHSGNATNSNNGYVVSYSNGKYDTTLSIATVEGEKVYTLETSFSIDVSFAYGGVSVEGAPFTDSVVSKVSFLSTQKGLQPIESTKTLVSHSPSQSTKASYSYYNQTVVTKYDGKKGTSVITDHADNDETKTESFEINDEKYTYVDNEQLLFALRCMNPSNTAKLQAYSPFVASSQVISTTFGNSAAAEFTLNGTKKEITYNEVTLALDAKNSGAKQTVWVAKTVAANGNTYRNVMLKYVAPLPYSIGELTYTLVSASFLN